MVLESGEWRVEITILNMYFLLLPSINYRLHSVDDDSSDGYLGERFSLVKKIIKKEGETNEYPTMAKRKRHWYTLRHVIRK